MGEVNEVVAQGYKEPMVRKSVWMRRQNAQNIRDTVKSEIEKLRLLDHTHHQDARLPRRIRKRS